MTTERPQTRLWGDIHRAPLAHSRASGGLAKLQQMGNIRWSPRTKRPDGLVRPLRVGEGFPTAVDVRNPANWRRVAYGWYVPAAVDGSIVEQRIVEQSVRLPEFGAVSGWASLRWRGATFFDGRAEGGRIELPVPLVVGGAQSLRPHPAIMTSQERLLWEEFESVGGLACTIPARALFDEIRRTRSLVQGVTAVDMAAAAKLITVAQMRDHLPRRNGWTGVPHARRVVALAIDDSRSPPETAMRLCWILDAALPPPLCNQPVFSVGGDFIGKPDLLDVEAGLVGEYDGAHHLEDDQRRHDREREELFRDHGLEYFCVVKGELGERARVVRRMHAARRRAGWLPPDRRAWTLEKPSWWRDPEARDAG